MQTLAFQGPSGGQAVAPRSILRDHAAYIAVVVFYCAAALATGGVFADAKPPSLALYSETFVQMMAASLVAFAIGHAIHVMIFVRPESIARTILQDMRRKYLTTERLWHALPVLVLMPLFMSAYTSFKALIPLLNFYSWDPAFAEWDRLLHAGLHPWQLLQPLVGDPTITWVINTVYHLWLFVLFGIIFWQAFSLRDRQLRMQFLLSFLLVWCVIGTVAATLLSSAGPVYYGRITGAEDIYQPLMAYLRAANETMPVLALEVQELLWSRYESGSLGLGSGISAMPSMHVATSFLFALLGWRTHRVLGIALSVFAFLILVGSVHLGWHYAIDGYLAIIATWLIWCIVGRLLAADRCLAPAR